MFQEKQSASTHLVHVFCILKGEKLFLALRTTLSGEKWTKLLHWTLLFIVLPSCKIGKVLKWTRFLCLHNFFDSVVYIKCLCKERWSIGECTEGKKKKVLRFIKSFFKQPQSEDSQCFIIRCPAVEYCLLNAQQWI